MFVQQDHYKKSYYETPFHSRTSELNILNEWQRWKDYTVATNYFRTDLEYFAVRNTTGVIDYTPMVKQKITVMLFGVMNKAKFWMMELFSMLGKMNTGFYV